MKKKVFLCVAVSLIIFESMARQTPAVDVQKKHSLMDFFRSGTKGQLLQNEKGGRYNENNTIYNNKSDGAVIGNSKGNVDIAKRK